MTKQKTRYLILILLFSLGGSRLVAGQSPSEDEPDTLYQTSTLGALQAGIYAGATTFGDLQRYGDFGLGTFEALDGEMIELDGQAYQVKSDGAAQPVDEGMTTPFAAVTFFEADQGIILEAPISCEDLRSTIDESLPSLNLMYAIKVTGTFSKLQVRSVPRQTEPYVGLAEALQNQVVFDYEDITGTLVGFRLPDYLAGVNAVGYHFHFIDDARSLGGHVLDCEAIAPLVEIDYVDDLQIDLPQNEAFMGADLTPDQ